MARKLENGEYRTLENGALRLMEGETPVQGYHTIQEIALVPRLWADGDIEPDTT